MSKAELDLIETNKAYADHPEWKWLPPEGHKWKWVGACSCKGQDLDCADADSNWTLVYG